MTVVVEPVGGGQGWRITVNNVPVPGLYPDRDGAERRGRRLANDLGVELRIVTQSGSTIRKPAPSRTF